MAENNNQILRSIGALEEAVKNLAEIARRIDDKAISERQAIYDRVDGLKEDVADLTSKFERIAEKVDDMEPTLENIQDKYMQSVGARHLGSVMWGIITAAVSMGIAAVSLIYTFWTHGH